MAYDDPRRATFAALIRRAVHETDVRVWMAANENGMPYPTRRITGLREYRLLSVSGQGTGYRVLAFEDIKSKGTVILRTTTGTTVWTQHPSPQFDQVVAQPMPVQVADLQDEVVRLRAEVKRLRVKYETSCPGLVIRHLDDGGRETVPCGGFVGHHGNCAEVW